MFKFIRQTHTGRIWQSIISKLSKESSQKSEIEALWGLCQLMMLSPSQLPKQSKHWSKLITMLEHSKYASQLPKLILWKKSVDQRDSLALVRITALKTRSDVDRLVQV